jgi:hypothetical protein
MALIGYARVSTTEQNLHLQQDALENAGCLKIYTDTISGAKSDRKGLAEALDFIRGGDTLVVWRLDRLGRSLKDLIERITDLHSRNIGLKASWKTLIPPPAVGNSFSISSGRLPNLSGILLRNGQTLDSPQPVPVGDRGDGHDHHSAMTESY